MTCACARIETAGAPCLPQYHYRMLRTPTPRVQLRLPACMCACLPACLPACLDAMQ